MISERLRYWIAQSESWHAFMDFQLPIENIANYSFLKRKEDFYITLFSKMMEILEEDLTAVDKKMDVLALAKGLEIYSLRETSREFQGINLAKNMLYVSALYYIAGYSASAFILAKLFNLENYKSEQEQFLSQFLRRELNYRNKYSNLLGNFLHSGEKEYIVTLYDIISRDEDDFLNNNPEEYITSRITKTLLEEFMDNNIWKDLSKNIEVSSQDYLDFVLLGFKKSPPVWSFFPSQKKALEKGILKNINKGFSLQMPTSAGKTAICELVIYDHFLKDSGSKILFLAPFRALASELKSGFSGRLSSLGIKTKSIYGGNIPTQSEKEVIQNVDLLISTPEKFMAVESVLPDIYNNFSLIICDEGHLIDDEGRGLSYELLLSKFRANSNAAHPKKFIFLSAIIPNIEHINEWLDGDSDTIVRSDYRPTQLDYAFLKNMPNRNFMLDVNPQMEIPYNFQLYNFLTRKDFQFINPITKRTNTYNHASIKSKSVASALKSLITGTVALFTPQKKGGRGVHGLAEETIKQIEILNTPKPQNYSNPEKLKKLAEHFERLFGQEYLLTRLVNYGVLFHHGDLPQNVRELIEDCIRNSDVRLIICTNTLAEGVNLPIKVIVIHSAKRYNPKRAEWENIKIRDLKNLVGRAGRAGKETKGLVIAVNPTDQQTLIDVINNDKNENAHGVLYFIIDLITKYIKGRQLIIDNDFLEKQSEQFLELIDSIDTSLINLLSEEIKEEELETQISLLMEKTYAFYQASDDEKETLENLFKLRGNKLKTYIQSDEYIVIKRSHSNIRTYEYVKSNIDLDQSIWTNTNSPLEEEWINEIFDLLFLLPQFKYKIEEFEGLNRTQLTKETLKKIVSLCLNGSWYNDISKETNIVIDTLLNIFTYIINSLVQVYSSKIVRIAFNLLENSDKEISTEVLNWPQYINYGLKDKFELDLVEIGFTDRDVIICLCDWIKLNQLKYDSSKELKKLVKDNKKRITKELENKLTYISFEKLMSSLDF